MNRHSNATVTLIGYTGLGQVGQFVYGTSYILYKMLQLVGWNLHRRMCTGLLYNTPFNEKLNHLM